ncbi:hypothetical protein [Neobacillus niacini]|uniref:hypothetical protein n=1 Tax=Neobacillus niacini TaxID=86668 RepID=UPI0021CB4B2E|nr:hypothetical protein [Neobacillus niacini]MCM3767814.1 hypothetical protein [Neobacillus niacini]
MNKVMILMVVLMAFLTTGCSVQLTTPNGIDAKADILASKGEELQYEFDKALEFVNELDDKNTISSKDQKKMDSQMEQVIDVIDEFKELEVPVMGGKIKDIADNNLKQREEVLHAIHEKAQKGNVEKDDLQDLKKALSADFSIKFFK